MENIVTPVDVDKFETLLMDAGYDSIKTDEIIQGFHNGFDLGYEGPTDVQIKSPNLKFREVGDKIDLWNKVIKEVKLRRYAGPFNEVPFSEFIQSPIGLIPKDNGKDTRLIFHLSYPRGTEKKSVNANTPEAKCTVKYPEFDQAIRMCLKAGKNCKLGQSDVRSAFRTLGMNKSSWKYLVMKTRLPLDNKMYYFVDKCLPFGASISCSHFQKVSDAIAYLVCHRAKCDILNYLDNFLVVALLASICNNNLQAFMDVCADINFPVNEDKTFWATTCIVFLGLLIDTVAGTVSVPTEKLLKATNLITTMLRKKSKKITVNQLQKICGFLNFLGQCVLLGHAFTRRLYAHLGGSKISKTKLKPHHHIRVTSEMRADLEIWLQFLSHPSAFCRGFMDFQHTWMASEIVLYSDAVKNQCLGFGAICENSWMAEIWPVGFIQSCDPSIEYLELFGVVAAVVQWIHRFRNRRIILFCDNMSVVAMINSMSTSCKNCMALLRILILKGMVENVRIFARHVRGKSNTICDMLSRNKIAQFRQLYGHDFEVEKTSVPQQLWPISKLWIL